MAVYDIEMERGDALRRKEARFVDAWMRAAAYAAGTDPDEPFAGASALAVETREVGLIAESEGWDEVLVCAALAA